MTNAEKLKTHLQPGQVYRRSDLEHFTSAVDRDLKKLVSENAIQKIGGGLYFFPKTTTYGLLPPNEDLLIQSFLKTTLYLKVNWNDYNKLGLGLTQLYNKLIVYNHKRHEQKKLAGFLFDFRRPTNGFPLEMSKEFLLVDLINNASELGESLSELKRRMEKSMRLYDLNKLNEYIQDHGKLQTKYFFKDLT